MRPARRSTAAPPRPARRPARRHATRAAPAASIQSMAPAAQNSPAPSTAQPSSTLSAKRAQPGRGRYTPARSRPRSSQPALTRAPRPMLKVSAAWASHGTSTRFINCVSTQHRDGDAHRRAHVLARVVARRQHLDRHEAQQADAVGRQRPRALRHVAAGEVAVVEQHRQHRLRKHHQRHRARQRQQQHQPQAPVEHRRIARLVVARLRRRQAAAAAPRPCATPSSAVGNSIRRSARFSHDTDPTASRDAMWVLISSEICATDTPSTRRRHLCEHAPHARVAPRRRDRRRHAAQPRQAADRAQRGHLHRQLHDAARASLPQASA